MLQLSGIDYLGPGLIAIALFVVLNLAFVVGFQIRRWRLRKSPAKTTEIPGSISSTLLGLLALILAFTFSMANSRFDQRRELAIQEANAIGTALLRTEFFPDTTRLGLKKTLESYLEERISFFESGTDVAKMIDHLKNADSIGKNIWSQVAEFSKSDPNLVKTSEIVPSLNQMIDLTTSRRAAGEANIPPSIQWFLLVLCISSTFLLGYERKDNFDWILVAGFSLMLSITVFSIFDLDRPRSGLVTLEEANSKIIELRGAFD
jgi:hypothetical protein